MLTHAQKDCLDFIVAYTAKHKGVAPSFDEIRDGLSLASISGVSRLVNALVERGFIRRLPHRWRCIEVIHRQPRVQYFRFDDETKGFVPLAPLRKAAG